MATANSTSKIDTLARALVAVAEARGMLAATVMTPTGRDDLLDAVSERLDRAGEVLGRMGVSGGRGTQVFEKP